MNKRLSAMVLAAMLSDLLAGCASGVLPPNIFATNTPHPVVIESTRMPSPELAARAYLDAWGRSDYASMYALLTPLSRDALSEEEFSAYYTKVENSATLQILEYSIDSVTEKTGAAEVTFTEVWRTILVGEMRRQVMMQLVNADGGWKVSWDESIVLPELKGGNSLAMVREPVSRGNIYDRNGLGLAYQTQVVTIGIIPGQLVDEGAVIGRLRDLLGLTSDEIYNMYANAQPDWYIPVAVLSKEDMSYNYQILKDMPGVVIVDTPTRYYYGGGTAAHVVGYIGQPSAEELPYYLSLGYGGDEKVGKLGIEAWGEQYLSGKPAAQLMVYSPSGNAVAKLAESDSVPAMNIYTTLDRKLQTQMERYVMGPLNGAAVVLKRDTGEVLAMMSNPTFDSNIFNTDNYNLAGEVSAVLADQNTPLLNRAAQGQYPLGSVFKVITMSAGLESGLFTPNSKYTCEGHFYDSTNHQYDDWTVEHQTKPHGTITLTQGLEQSCNVWFWHIGYELFWNEDRMRVPNTARGFGLGKRTGIQAIPEENGFVPDPAWKQETLGEEWTDGDALNQAIGQGLLQVTPLQVADYIAAVGNGGSLYRPQLIQSIQTYNNEVVFAMTPELRGNLPVSAEHLANVQEAMKGVVYAEKGTARKRFIGLSDAVRIAGKTGTAQDLPRFPHAWFAAYTFGSNYVNKDDIAVVVIVENIGEGSVYAAPMVRRIMEIYFRGHPGPMYAWESTYGVMGTATPEISETPTFGESPTAAP